jgi:hypothetical protein
MQRMEQSCVELTAELVPAAERELAAYARAVQELYGTVQARQAVEDWMEELELMDWPLAGAIPNWRRITTRAAARLAVAVAVDMTSNQPEKLTEGMFSCSGTDGSWLL